MAAGRQRLRRFQVSRIGDEHRPQQRAGEHRHPAHPRRDRVADDAVGPEHDELVQQQQQKHRQRLLRQREDAHAQLELVRQEADHQEGERRADRASCPSSRSIASPHSQANMQAGDARRAERPVDHEQQQQVRARRRPSSAAAAATARISAMTTVTVTRRRLMRPSETLISSTASIAASAASALSACPPTAAALRDRGRAARAARASTSAKVSAGLRSTFVTRRDRIAGREDLVEAGADTSRSPRLHVRLDRQVRQAELRGRRRCRSRSSGCRCGSPGPASRAPRRVIRISVAVYLSTCITWPTTPNASSTGWPRNTPSSAPLLMTHRCGGTDRTVDVDDLRDQRALADALGGLADLAQPAVLLVERFEPQQLDACDAQLLGELRVLACAGASDRRSCR